MLKLKYFLPGIICTCLLGASPPGKESETISQKAGRSSLSGEMEVIFFNVYQADSTLINTPGGKHILIDGGKCESDWNSFDAAERVIIPFLKERGISRLDLVIGTHPDFDHIGGLSTLLKDRSIEVGRYIDPGKEHTTRYYKEVLKLVRERDIPYQIGRAGQRLDFGEGVHAEIVSPPKLLSKNNDCSVVVRASYGQVSFIFTGDAEEEAEMRMKSRYGRRLGSTVLKVGHHGSRGSSGSVFLRYVRPRMAVISCGENNKFGHPHEETLNRLRYVGAKVYRTDQMGTIIMRTDGKNLTVSKLKK